MTWDNELNIAKEATLKAGAVLRQVSRGDVLSHAGRDVKHQGDLEAEQVIIRHLNAATNYPVLAEESGESGIVQSDEPIWIVDPLDGTLNFSRNIGLCCVSIALWQSNQPILGIVYDFNREELFSGLIGKGAWCNDLRMEVSPLKTCKEAVLATGFPVNRDFATAKMEQFLAQVQEFKKIRLFGTAALSMAYVAAGRVDAYTEEDIMLWDVAAGIALVRAAGGEVSFEFSQRKKWATVVRAGYAFHGNQ